MQYKSNIVKSIIGTVVLEVILGGILYFIINMYTSFNPRYALIILIILGIIFAIVTIRSNYTIVELFDDRLLVTQGGKERTINYNDYEISSYVVNHSYNGVHTNAERFLRLYNGENIEDIKLHNFSKKSFEKIFSHIGKSTIDKKEVSGILIEKEFLIPKDDILKDHMKFFRRFLLIGMLGMLALGVGLVFMVRNSLMSPKEIAYIFGIGYIPFALLLIGGIGGAIYMEYRKKKKKTPYKVIVDKDYLEIDRERIPMNNIEKILTTPPGYTDGTWKNSRDMIITFRDKKGTKKLYFGVRSKMLASKKVFEQYGQMCDMIQASSVLNNVEFVYDL